MATTYGRTDKIDIFNLVATLLSTEAITDAEFATPTLKVTKAINAVYRLTRNAILREHNWRFARVVTELIDAPATVTFPGWNYFYYYPDLANLPTGDNKPQGSVYLRKVFTDTESQEPEPIDYKIFNVVDPDNSVDGIFIATQEDDAYAEYTNFGFDDDAGSTYGGVKSINYDPMFNMALALNIASLICKKVTGDERLAVELAERHAAYLAKTKIYDLREERVTETKLKTNDYINAR